MSHRWRIGAAFYGGYFRMAFQNMFIRKYSYKAGILLDWDLCRRSLYYSFPLK